MAGCRMARSELVIGNIEGQQLKKRSSIHLFS